MSQLQAQEIEYVLFYMGNKGKWFLRNCACLVEMSRASLDGLDYAGLN